MPDKETVRYIGPNAKGDPRTMTVASDEADRLEKTKLWERKRKATAKKEPEVKTNA